MASTAEDVIVLQPVIRRATMRAPEVAGDAPLVPGVVVDLPIALVTFQYLLSAAFEGGSNYWYIIEDYERPTSDDASPPVRFDAKYEHLAIDYPVSEGYGVVISDAAMDKNERHGPRGRITKVTLTLPKLIAGARLLVDKYPARAGILFGADFDGSDADVFLQLCVFGEVVYT